MRIEYNLTLCHLRSGIIEENLDEGVDHIVGEWHKVSNKKKKILFK